MRPLRVAALTIALLSIAPPARAECVGETCPAYATSYSDRGSAHASDLHEASHTLVIAGKHSWYGLAAAFDTRDGTLRWGTLLDDLAVRNILDVAISPDGATMFITGSREYPISEDSQQFTAALDAATGDVIWWHATKSPGYWLDYGDHVLVAPDGATVYSVGNATPPPDEDQWAQHKDIRILAYDAVSGERLWKVRHRGEWSQEIARDAALSPDGRTLLIAGQRHWGWRAWPEWYVEAIDASTGATRWRDLWRRKLNAIATELDLSPNGRRVYVGGTWLQDRGAARLVAYRVGSGNRIWARSMRRSNVTFNVADVAVARGGPCIGGLAHDDDLTSLEGWADFVQCRTRSGKKTWLHFPPMTGHTGTGGMGMGVELDRRDGIVVMADVERVPGEREGSTTIVTRVFEAGSGALSSTARYSGYSRYVETTPIDVRIAGDAIIVPSRLADVENWSFLALGYQR